MVIHTFHQKQMFPLITTLCKWHLQMHTPILYIPKGLLTNPNGVFILLVMLSVHVTLALSSGYPSIIKVRDGLDTVVLSVVVTQTLLGA